MKKQPHYKIRTGSEYTDGDEVSRAVAVEHMGEKNVAAAEVYAAENGLVLTHRAIVADGIFAGVYNHYRPKKTPAK
jgi:hypothetical protein